MYTYERKTIEELLSSMKELHVHILTTQNASVREEFLSICMETAAAVTEIAAREKEDRKLDDQVREAASDVICLLDEYRDILGKLQHGMELSGDTGKGMDVIIRKVLKNIYQIPIRYKIVFLPYKADMWDSLESIYLAAKDDPTCDVYVCPIPYYEMNSDKNQWEFRYDGERFYVPIVSYSEFLLENEQPDVAYIHNPYDNYNFVTMVHPSFYSSEIKKHVRKLIYVPYYVTAGGVADEHMEESCFPYMDYMITQSQFTKEQYKSSIYYDKILPFGSPKFDKVIRKNKDGVSMPKDWEQVLKDKRLLMLNSSINDLLRADEVFMEKLGAFFDLIKKYPNVGLIWRPHPLLKATLKAMRTHLLPAYEALEKKYIEERIGVIDTNPDISDTVALADGYIGSGASSVINLFGVVGKPIFIFNNNIRGTISDETRKVLKLHGVRRIDDRLYFVAADINAIFSLSLDALDEPLCFEASIPKLPRWNYSKGGMDVIEGKLYLGSGLDQSISIYDPKSRSFEEMRVDTGTDDKLFLAPCKYADSLWLFSGYPTMSIEYDTLSGERIIHKECFEELFEGIATEQYTPTVKGFAYRIDGEQIILHYANGRNNNILRIFIGKNKYDFITIGSENTGIVIRGSGANGLYFSWYGADELIYSDWSALNEEFKWIRYKIPHLFLPPVNEEIELRNGYSNVKEMDKYIILLPAAIPDMLKIDRDTGEITHIAEGFWKECETIHTADFQADNPFYIGSCFVLDGNKLFAVRTNDMKSAIIDVEEDSCEEFYPHMTDEQVKELLQDGHGFEKTEEISYFSMFETRFLPIEAFLNGFSQTGYADIKDRQIEALSEIACNLDGSCGVHTHEYIMRDIR